MSWDPKSRRGRVPRKLKRRVLTHNRKVVAWWRLHRINEESRAFWNQYFPPSAHSWKDVCEEFRRKLQQGAAP